MLIEQLLTKYNKAFATFDFSHKKVLIRVDLNVPFNADGSIADDYRLKAIVPLLEKLVKNNATIIIATHIGRPKGIDPSLSTLKLLPWFKKKNYCVQFHPTFKPISTPGIYLLENLRFFSGEQQGDSAFAQQLASLAEIYINDAFALLHRSDTSITLVPLLFPITARLLGPLVLNELEHLKPLVEHPESPYTVFIGGGKVSTKLPLLTALLDKADHLIICPALCFTFFKARGYKVGASLVEESMIERSRIFLKEAQETKTNIILPQQVQVIENYGKGSFKDVSISEIQPDEIGISLAQATLESLKPLLRTTKTLFINAAMHIPTIPSSEERFIQLLKLIEKDASSAYKIIGGGDSVALTVNAGLAHVFNYVSTGGGATLAYIGDEKLPGLAPYLPEMP